MKASIMLVTSLTIIAIQLLDGVEAGIFGVVAVVITSDLMRGSGRFNVAQGLMALCVGIGAALSNVLGGFVVEHAGFVAAYLILAVIAAIAFVVFASLMPETGHEAASLSCAFVTGRFER